LKWHLATARELAAFKPDVLISIEPHSAIAVWLYFGLFGGDARLFIHHHEFYAREDFESKGMRLVSFGYRLEKSNLFARAEWISETNLDRLKLLAVDAKIDPRKGHVLPNYPPRRWVERAFGGTVNGSDRFRIVYLGSASLEDTFIEDFALWVAAHSDVVSMDVVGNNISDDAWLALEKIGAPNISLNKQGISYDELPETLRNYDVGVILYKGRTKNFVYNVPNKAIEYLAAGLDVWYPTQMRSMKTFAEENPDLPLVEMDFADPLKTVPEKKANLDWSKLQSFSAESALEPLIEQIEAGIT
jgi:hypothetical protein